MIALSSAVSVVSVRSYLIKCMVIIAIIISMMGIYFRGRPMQIIFCAVGFYGVLIAIDKIMLTVIAYSIPAVFQEILQEPVKVTMLAFMCKVVLFLCVVALNRRFKKESSFNLIEDSEWLRFLFFPLLTIMTMLLFVTSGGEKESYAVFLSLGLIFGNFIVFYMIKDIVTREKRVQEMLVAQERSRNQTDMYVQMNQNYEVQRHKIHEFKNHMNCMQGLLESGQNRAALDYVHKINGTWIEEMDYVLTNHAIVNTVLNEKYKKAKAKHIPMIMAISDLEGFEMREEDIVILLANLLDNAIEAAEKIENRDKIIKFKMAYNCGRLIISVRNPVLENIRVTGSRIPTSKEEKENHGIGMINIGRVVRAYHGKYLFSSSEGYFTSTVIMKNV